MRTLTVLFAASALVGTACSPDGPTGSSSGSPADPPDGELFDAGGTPVAPTGGGGGGGRFVQGLVPFDDCATFLEHVQAEALDRVGPYGLDGSTGRWFGDEPAEEPAEEPADSPTGGQASPGDDAAGSGFTGTNVQVVGVDEPDIVKTDGRRILAVSDNVLSHVDISSGGPVLTDQLGLPTGWGHELFFRGDRAIVVTNAGAWGRPMPVDGAVADQSIVPPSETGPVTEIVEIDLTDPANLRVAATLQIEGQYLSARAIDDHVRLAMTSSPARLPWLFPQTPTGEPLAEQANREIIESSTVDDWVPGYVLAGPNGTDSGTLLDCGRVHRPAEFAGFDVVSVLDLDLGAGLASAVDGSADAVGVLAAGQTVASSMDRFYVATTTWYPTASGDASVDDDQLSQWSEQYVTEIHAFAIAPGEPTRYVASGSVPGSLLGQFSLDEHEGDLRVVHTDGSPWDQGDLSETFLTVLREDADRLEPVGSVGGLGRGEQLYSARLMGDVGFAVTFRQIDPFYVLDLSDPTNPRVTGELKIPGFSTYLHPVGDDLVLGLGQDALETGRVTGLKLSLFDVSDRTDPREVAVWTLPDASSPAESDHRAFQMWGNTAIVPVQSWRDGFDGVILFEVDAVGGAITEIGRVEHAPTEPAVNDDCRIIDAADLTPEGSDLYWVALDGRLQVCESGRPGGWHGGWCEVIPADAIAGWFWDDDTRARDLEVLQIRPDDVVEMCWPDGSSIQDPIRRSLVADGTLYTVSPRALQANDLDSLAVLGQVPLR